MKLIYKIVLILAIAWLENGCKSKEQPTATETPKESLANVITLNPTQLKNAGVETMSLSSSKMTQNLKVFGHTFFPPENMVTISSPYGGIVKSIQVLQGQHIAKGQLVAVLEDPKFIDLQQDYLLTKSKLKLVQLDYERQRDLNQSKANSDKVYQMAENEFRSNQILLKSLSEKLKLLGIQPQNLTSENMTRTITIRANTSGFISTIYANMGKYILPSESIADIINQSRPFLKLKIYEKDLQNIHIGMRLKAYSNSDTSTMYACEIRNINPQVDADGSAEVVCSFLNMNKPIYQNMNMIANLELSSGQVTSLPDEAIVDFEGKSYVFISLGNQKFKMVPIKKGNSDKGITELLEKSEIGINPVVVKGAYTLLMALKNKEE